MLIAVGFFVTILFLLLSLGLGIASFLLQRFFLVNSIALGVIAITVTDNMGWTASTYCLIFLAVFIVTAVLQYISRKVRISFSIASCLVAGYYGFESSMGAELSARILSITIWVLVVGALNFMSCAGIELGDEIK